MHWLAEDVAADAAVQGPVTRGKPDPSSIALGVKPAVNFRDALKYLSGVSSSLN